MLNWFSCACIVQAVHEGSLNVNTKISMISWLKNYQEVAKFVDFSFLEQKLPERVPVQRDLLRALHDRLDERALV